MSEGSNQINEVLVNLGRLYDENPMFKFSLASKELFHSNFIDWMLNLDIAKKEILSLFLGKRLENPEIVHVFRETQNIDLIIAYREKEGEDIKLILIENKFKSYPYKDQLQKYDEKERKIETAVKKELGGDEDGSTDIGNPKIVKKILLSIEKPFFFEKDNKYKNWEFISYDLYLEKIKDIKGKTDKAKDDKNITYLNDYYEFTNAIIYALKNILEKEYFCLNVLKNTDTEIVSKLDKMRINDLFQKNIGAQLLQKVQEKYESVAETNPKSEVVFLNELQISKRAQVNILRKYGEKNAILYGIRHHAGYIEYVLNCSKDADFVYPKKYPVGLQFNADPADFIKLFEAIKQSFDEFIEAKYYPSDESIGKDEKNNIKNIPQWNNRQITKQKYENLFKHSGTKIKKPKNKPKKGETTEEAAAYNKYYKADSGIQIYLKTKPQENNSYYGSFKTLSEEIVKRFNEMDKFLSGRIEEIFK